MTSPRLDAGSFRDRESRVFHHQGRVLRALSPAALAAWEALEKTGFFARFVASGRLVATARTELPAELAGAWAAALEHERVPVISYPYEWSFGMLRDAALLQLELLRAALEEGLTAKDASAYNVQWRGARPLFIDVTSFEPWREGDPWAGYLQFCRLFLYPLMLTAYRDVAFQPWLRGALEGIEPEAMARLLGWRDRFRPGVLTDVVLQARFQAAHARRRDETSLRSEIRRAGFRKEMIVHNVERLQKVVRGLRWRRAASQWADYAEACSYDAESRERKRDFVREVARKVAPERVWDLGANTGEYSLVVAPHAGTVVAVDADHLAVERLYQRLVREGPANVLPLLGDLADPSPGLGWRGAERTALESRVRPDLVLVLALVHHLAIAAHVPVPEILDWLAGLGCAVVLEYVTPDDPMVRRLLRDKDDVYRDYDPPAFAASLEARFTVVEQIELMGGLRRLYRLAPR